MAWIGEPPSLTNSSFVYLVYSTSDYRPTIFSKADMSQFDSAVSKSSYFLLLIRLVSLRTSGWLAGYFPWAADLGA